jgi:hypothetical protein
MRPFLIALLMDSAMQAGADINEHFSTIGIFTDAVLFG